MTRPDDPRIHDLLADRALHGLDDADSRELQTLGADTDDTYDLAAAAIDIATLPIEPMPTALADHILAARVPRTLAGWAIPGSMMPAPGGSPAVGDPASHARGAARGVRRRSPAVTWFAVAATILVVVGASWWLLRERRTAAPTLAALRADLVASAADAAPVAWKASPEAPGASGDVVWSPSAQRGYMRFVGLAPNDPAKTQYQLWIFDRTRDQAFPVDGGVFDVTSSGEVIVPITAKLHVDDATLFAVTVERPGGVVVSKREHIVVTAARS
jgi:anti-sigma-K factor RskA